jgi:hypothetical protein
METLSTAGKAEGSSPVNVGAVNHTALLLIQLVLALCLAIAIAESVYELAAEIWRVLDERERLKNPKSLDEDNK